MDNIQWEDGLPWDRFEKLNFVRTVENVRKESLMIQDKQLQLQKTVSMLNRYKIENDVLYRCTWEKTKSKPSLYKHTMPLVTS